MRHKQQSAQSVIEYILISLFTIFISLGTLKLSVHLLESKTQEFAEKVGVDISEFSFNPFTQ